MNYQLAVGNIRNELKNYIFQHGLKALVIGLSGGIDSALCTALAAPVCRETGIDLVGRSISIETNKPDEIARGKAIGEAFCTDFREIDLTCLYHNTVPIIEEAAAIEEGNHAKKVRLGNIKARLRMIYLYNQAQYRKGLVLSTDNYTEYLLGFWTLHGDVGDYGMIQELWKTEVYEMSSWLVENELTGNAKEALQLCIDALPTDGLGITNSDLDQLGTETYAEVDHVLKELISNGRFDNPGHPVVKRHYASAYKRKNPLNISRSIIDKDQ